MGKVRCTMRKVGFNMTSRNPFRIAFNSRVGEEQVYGRVGPLQHKNSSRFIRKQYVRADSRRVGRTDIVYT